MPAMRHLPHIAIAALLLGCSSPSGKGTFEEMKKAACAGDVPGFFSHVDKTAIAESGKKRALSITDGKGLVGAMAKEMASGQIDVAVQKTFTEWEDEIKKGSAGYLCKMEFTSSDEREQGADVKWKTASGKDKIWVFQRFDKKLLAVELTAPEEPIDVAKECADFVGVFKAAQDAIAASQKAAPDTDPKDTGASAKKLNDLADAAEKAAISIEALPLRSAGLKQRATDSTAAFNGIAKAIRSVTKAPEGTAPPEGATDDVPRLIKLYKEQFRQLSEHCKTPVSAPPP